MRPAIKCITSILLTLFIQTGKSCVCHTPGIRSNYECDYTMINQARVIVKAKILSLQADAFEQTARIHVRITDLYKGTTGDTLTFMNYAYKSSCDESFKPGEETVLFLHEDSTGRLIYTPCSGTFTIYEVENSVSSRAGERTMKILASLKKEKSIAGLRYSNGQLMATGKFINGEPDGKWEIFDYLGNLVETGNYKNGRPDGEWIRYEYTYETEPDAQTFYRPRRVKEKTEKFTINWKNGVYKGIVKQEGF